MSRGTYIGTDPALKGKTALLLGTDQRDLQEGATELKAQFDDRTLDQAFGWHVFKASDFDIAG